MNNNKIINIGHEDPLIFRDWWTACGVLPAIMTQQVLVHEYKENEFEPLIAATHKFHQTFGTDAPFASIVYGNGSTQVINAILYAISRKFNRTIIVGYEPPVYILMHEFLTNCKMIEITFDLTRTDIDVEIVIDPNNPSGEHRIHKSKATYVIYDRAYNWPIYIDSHTAKTSPENNHITVYTISKALGMGGLHLGWAFINDPNLTKEIQRALVVMGTCPNSFGIEAATYIFNNFVHRTDLIHSYCNDLKTLIDSRRKLLSSCPQFIVTNTSGPYAWIKSNTNLEPDIAKFLLERYNIQVYSGVQFESTPEYARLSLICSTKDFNEAINRLLTD
jgi:aspartate/methionine/tyrosine aminotransferase